MAALHGENPMKNKPTQCAPVRPLAIRFPGGFSLRMLWGEPFKL
jgi:hypothetical protein